MPFKSSKITYGIPSDGFNRELINEYIEDVKKELNLKREIVGIKLFFSKEEYDKCKIEPIKGKTAYCVMVERATRGHSCKSVLENHNCDGGTTALGLERSTERIESGEEYFSYNLYATNAVARRMRQNVMSLHREEASTYGVLIQPLKDFEVIPDVIILIGTPYHSMSILQGYVYNNGLKPTLNCKAMQALCSECTTVPYMTGEMNISTLCPSTRMLAKWKEEELAIGIPYERFEETIRGIMATSMKK
ncbi:MAG TPA: hypothetical protein DC000_01135 [Clostridiales bacterium]|nr:hypothetical protein [Clostridiales bacterium]